MNSYSYFLVLLLLKTFFFHMHLLKINHFYTKFLTCMTRWVDTSLKSNNFHFYILFLPFMLFLDIILSSSFHLLFFFFFKWSYTYINFSSSFPFSFFPKLIWIWCNGYRRWKWTRRHEFKSWMRLIAFHIALIPLGKVWIQLFSLRWLVK